jgi:outer membrane biosynthesis protein TonB
MKKSGLADSPFFAPTQPKVEPITPPSANPPVQKVEPEKIEKPKTKKVEQPSNHDTTVSRYHDTTTPSVHGVVIEVIRKAVKEFGKEAATHRFTEAEKREVANIIYTYKNSGIKTSENEITRIAVNFIMGDYKENGENSVLHKILKALNE